MDITTNPHYPFKIGDVLYDQSADIVGIIVNALEGDAIALEDLSQTAPMEINLNYDHCIPATSEHINKVYEKYGESIFSVKHMTQLWPIKSINTYKFLLKCSQSSSFRIFWRVDEVEHELVDWDLSSIPHEDIESGQFYYTI